MRVLVVDDNALVRTMLKAILEDEGYGVDVAEDGHDALIKVKESKPDLVITDFYMTKMHGDMFVRILRDSPVPYSTIPVIGLAGTAESEKKLRAAGVDEYMAKPFLKKRLLESVEQLLSKK